jgi:hypothetical protein
MRGASGELYGFRERTGALTEEGDDMTKEERRDLHEDSVQLAYQAIKFSPLFSSPEFKANERADELAEEFANKVDARLAVLIDEELDRIEAKAEAA